MKKSILLMSALFFCGMTALAQEPLYKMKLTLQDGSKLAVLTDEIDSMQLTTVKAAEVHVTERYKTSSSIGINIEAEASVTRVQAAIVAGSEKDPNINYTEYVQKHSVCDARDPIRWPSTSSSRRVSTPSMCSHTTRTVCPRV